VRYRAYCLHVYVFLLRHTSISSSGGKSTTRVCVRDFVPKRRESAARERSIVLRRVTSKMFFFFFCKKQRHPSSFNSHSDTHTLTLAARIPDARAHHSATTYVRQFSDSDERVAAQDTRRQVTVLSTSPPPVFLNCLFLCFVSFICTGFARRCLPLPYINHLRGRLWVV
jgi:hypothetical protein